MRPSTRTALPLALGLSLLALGGAPAGAAGINDLSPTYGGLWIPRTPSNAPAAVAFLEIPTTHPNGKFAGTFGVVPITGKVAKGGKVTFAGKFTGKGFTAKITKGKGQLSATGRFLLGGFTYTGTGSEASKSGAYLYTEETGEPTLQGARTGHGSAPTDGLSDQYAGSFHDNKIADREALQITLEVLTRNGGNFTATFDGVSVSGKVDSAGKVTFQGKTVEGSSSLKVEGSGFLSSTGDSLLGSVKFTGKGQLSNLSGKGTFEIYVPT